MSLTRRSSLRLLAGVAVAGSAAALASACAAPAPIAAPTPPPTMASVLKIGILLPYTESSIGVDIGLSQKRAADLYLKQHGGKLGRQAVSLVYSSESIETAINKTKVRTLTDVEHVGVLMGGARADSAQVMRDAAENLRLVYLATNATTNALTQSKYVFRTSASAQQLCEPLGEWAAGQGQRDFYVCGVDDPFGIESMDAFVAGLATRGGGVTSRVTTPSGANMAGVIAAIQAQPTKNVFAAFATDDAEAFLTEWQKQGLSQAGYQLSGPGPLTDEEVLAQVKSAAIGVVTSFFWAPDLSNAENTSLAGAFPKEYVDDETGQPVSLNGYAVPMWDAMTALDLALATTGGDITNAATLIDALEAESFGSPRGMFAFDKRSHNPVQAALVRRVVASSAGTPINSTVATVAASVAVSTSRE